MAMPAPTLWLHPAEAGDSCGGCDTAISQPTCRAHASGKACAQPQLAGHGEELRRVLQGLNREVVDPEAGRGIVDLQWVQSLRIEHGEAELTLTFAPVCGVAKELAEDAFAALRRLLPDTDVYVRHAA